MLEDNKQNNYTKYCIKTYAQLQALLIKYRLSSALFAKFLKKIL